MKCGFTWRAPMLTPGTTNLKKYVPTKCDLPKDHEGEHRSRAGVVTPNITQREN